MLDGHTVDESMLGTPQHASDGDFFRQVNDRIVELGERFGFQRELVELICECDDPGCTLHLSVPVLEYEHVRRARGWHVVAPAHEPFRRIVARGEGYVVVED